MATRLLPTISEGVLSVKAKGRVVKSKATPIDAGSGGTNDAMASMRLRQCTWLARREAQGEVVQGERRG